MPISGEMYVWGEKARNVEPEPGVYAFYDENEVLIYIGGSSNLRERFSHYLGTNFSDDPCKRPTRYYKREHIAKHEERENELLEEHKRRYGKYPTCNEHL